MRRNNYVEMNIDEMKDVKETWQIHLKLYARKLRKLRNTEETKENRSDIHQLEMNYTFCINTISDIISIYKELIDLAEMCELGEDFFLKKIKEVQRLHANFRLEANKKSIKDIANKLSIEELNKKLNLNI